jgi:hypothetical protein
VFLKVGSRRFALDFHGDPPLGPRRQAGSSERVKYGFVAEFADFECRTSILGVFLPRMAYTGSSLDGYRSIDT